LGGRIVVPLSCLGKRWLTMGKRTLLVGRKSVPSEPGKPSVQVKSTFHAGKIGQYLIGNRAQPLIEGLEPAFRWVLQKPEFRLGRLTGLPLEFVALGAACTLLLCRVKPEKIYRQIDWGLLVMFTGLFVVVHAFRLHVVSRWGIQGWGWLLDRPVDLLSLVSAALSNLVSNVPAVLLLEPVLNAVPQARHESAWLALAMSSTFAGDLTVLDSVANLIVVEKASREGVTISFWEYCKVGAPLTIVTLALGIGWLHFVLY